MERWPETMILILVGMVLVLGLLSIGSCPEEPIETGWECRSFDQSVYSTAGDVGMTCYRWVIAQSDS